MSTTQELLAAKAREADLRAELALVSEQHAAACAKYDGLCGLINGHGLVKALHDGCCSKRQNHGSESNPCYAVTVSDHTAYEQAASVKAYLLGDGS